MIIYLKYIFIYLTKNIFFRNDILICKGICFHIFLLMELQRLNNWYPIDKKAVDGHPTTFYSHYA